MSSSFAVVLAARFVTALATGAFWAVGFVIATAAAGPARATRAVGVMMGGLTLANVVGVPIGSFVGHYTGWRGPYWGAGRPRRPGRRIRRPVHSPDGTAGRGAGTGRGPCPAAGAAVAGQGLRGDGPALDRAEALRGGVRDGCAGRRTRRR
ncbi:MFS transporter [Streptomyces flaveolus]|uniref:MFS transporter n=1 Tax=Streptomyces flaveolus TaxID=67297 RepID=UPI0033B7F162